MLYEEENEHCKITFDGTNGEFLLGTIFSGTYGLFRFTGKMVEDLGMERAPDLQAEWDARAIDSSNS